MLRHLTWSAAALAFLTGASAAAQTIAPPDPEWMLVAPEDRLTLGGVFADADIVMQLVMGGLVLAALAALVVWIVQAFRVGRGAHGFAGAMAYLSALGAAGPLIGFFGSAYTLLHSFIGVYNVRPAPSLSIMAPGFAEALLSAMLGLLAAAIAVIGHRHLKARLYSVGIEADEPAAAPLQSLSRQARVSA